MPRPSDPMHALPRMLGQELLVLDFDGVLAPIVDDPATSRMPDDVAEALARLVQIPLSVVVLSGRPAGFLARHARIPGVRLLGSYGAEEVDSQDAGRIVLDPSVEPWVDAVRSAEADVRAALSGGLSDRSADAYGVRVESKPISVAVHWRQAPQRSRAAAAVKVVVSDAAAAHGLRVEAGKFVLELLPPVALDKGVAMRRLLAEAQPDVVSYLGDDLGDLPALTAVRQAGGQALVVVHGRETPQPLLEVATRLLDGVPGVAAELSARATDASGAATGDAPDAAAAIAPSASTRPSREPPASSSPADA